MDSDKKTERVSQAAQSALNLSHGVKNILQTVTSGMDVVEQSLEMGDVDSARKSWPILKRNLERINKLVLDMLAYSNESRPVFELCDFNGIVCGAVQDLAGETQRVGKRIVVDADPAVGEVMVDADEIYDVVLNLLLNAVYAVDDNVGVIEVSTSVDTANGMVVLMVSDNGAGIENMDEIFEPFHSTKAKLGTGLGLAIVKKIVGEHDGTITTVSSPGNGAVFTICIPLSR